MSVLLDETFQAPILLPVRRPPDSERLYELVGQNLVRRRREAKVSQTKLGRLCGLTRGSIANIELGNQRLTLHTLATLAQALDIDMRSLLPARDELLQRGAGTAEPVITSRVERAAGESRNKVASFIATPRPEVAGDVGKHREEGQTASRSRGR